MRKKEIFYEVFVINFVVLAVDKPKILMNLIW